MNLTKDEVLKLVVSVCDPNTVSPIEKDGEFIVVTQDELLAFANAIADAQREKDAQIAENALIPVITTCEQVALARGEIVDAIRANKS